MYKLYESMGKGTWGRVSSLSLSLFCSNSIISRDARHCLARRKSFWGPCHAEKPTLCSSLLALSLTLSLTLVKRRTDDAVETCLEYSLTLQPPPPLSLSLQLSFCIALCILSFSLSFSL